MTNVIKDKETASLLLSYTTKNWSRISISRNASLFLSTAVSLCMVMWTCKTEEYGVFNNNKTVHESPQSSPLLMIWYDISKIEITVSSYLWWVLLYKTDTKGCYNFFQECQLPFQSDCSVELGSLTLRNCGQSTFWQLASKQADNKAWRNSMPCPVFWLIHRDIFLWDYSGNQVFGDLHLDISDVKTKYCQAIDCISKRTYHKMFRNL